MADKRLKTCANCRAFTGAADGRDEGECRRRAPVAVDANGFAVWSRVRRDEFCEDHLIFLAYNKE